LQDIIAGGMKLPGGQDCSSKIATSAEGTNEQLPGKQRHYVKRLSSILYGDDDRGDLS